MILHESRIVPKKLLIFEGKHPGKQTGAGLLLGNYLVAPGGSKDARHLGEVSYNAAWDNLDESLDNIAGTDYTDFSPTYFESNSRNGH